MASFLFEKWIFNAIFVNLPLEGLVKDFYLSAWCQKNLQLTQHILYKIMTFEEWEVATPKSEKVVADLKKPDIFT